MLLGAAQIRLPSRCVVNEDLLLPCMQNVPPVFC